VYILHTWGGGAKTACRIDP